MTKQRDNVKDRLAAMLRRWGADEAARTVDIGTAPVLRRRRARISAALGRWVPLTVAAAMLLAGVGFFLASRAGSPSQSDDSAVREDLVLLKEELETERAGREAALSEMSQMQEKLTEEKDKLVALDELYKAAQEKLRAPKDVKGPQTDLEEKVRTMTVALQEANAAIAEQKQQLTRLREIAQRAEGEAKKAEAKLVAFGVEINRYIKLREQALAEKRKAEDELALMKVHRSAMMDCFQEAYLAVIPKQEETLAKEASPEGEAPLSPATGGLHARQELARRSRLIERCARIRRDARDESTRRLLDKLEVVLTQLELLDTSDVMAVQGFSSMLRGSAIRGQIDKALETEAEGAPVRVWLFEAMLILRGAERVG